MAWLESHGNLARHPKTRRLMQRMGWTLPFTIGNLHLLWYWALEYAPTGDLTKFDPQDLTYDLDLGNATPEEFLEAMVEAEFIDRFEDGALRLHDWPEYTAKSLRPKYRRTPERWHQVLRSYGLPVITRRTTRSAEMESKVNYWTNVARQRLAADSTSRGNARTTVQARPPIAESSRSAGHALRADRRMTTPFSANSIGELTAPDGEAESHSDSSDESIPADPAMSGQNNDANETVTIPEVLSAQPGFIHTWWPKFLAMYEDQGSPLTSYEQSELLKRLAQEPKSAVQKLKIGVKNYWGNLPGSGSPATAGGNTS